MPTWMVRKTVFGRKYYRKKCGMHVLNKPEINTKVCFHFLFVYNLSEKIYEETNKQKHDKFVTDCFLLIRILHNSLSILYNIYIIIYEIMKSKQ